MFFACWEQYTGCGNTLKEAYMKMEDQALERDDFPQHCQTEFFEARKITVQVKTEFIVME